MGCAVRFAVDVSPLWLRAVQFGFGEPPGGLSLACILTSPSFSAGDRVTDRVGSGSPEQKCPENTAHRTRVAEAAGGLRSPEGDVWAPGACTASLAWLLLLCQPLPLHLCLRNAQVNPVPRLPSRPSRSTRGALLGCSFRPAPLTLSSPDLPRLP